MTGGQVRAPLGQEEGHGQVRALTATSEAVNDVVYPAGLAVGGCLCAGSLVTLAVLLFAGYQVNRRLRRSAGSSESQ